MKTKKSIWKIALSLIVMFALVLGFGLNTQRATVNAQNDDHITFDITVDGFNEKSIESNYQGLLEVRYTVTENTGVDAMQLRIDFSSAFTLERIEALKTTSLGEPTINNGTAVEPLNGENYVAYENITLEENNIYIGANIVYEHVNNTYSATGDTLIIAYYRLNSNPTEGVYPFGFWNANNGDGFSTAWKNVANAEQSGTHTPVIINYTDAVVYIMGDYEFTLTGGQKVYDGIAALNSAITVSDNNNENRPTLNYVWFQGISSNSDTYRKLDSNPVNAGQYFVVLEYEATNRYRAYCGYTETEESGVYTLDSTEGKVAAYIITLRPVTITIDNQTSAYGDAIVSPHTYQITDGTVVTGDDLGLSITTTATASSNIGTYPITGTRGNYNYDVRFVDGTYTITPKAITIKIDDRSSKYGAPLAELTWGLKTGSTLVGDDQLADLNVVLATTPASLANANAGTYPISGTYNNANYTVTFENGTYTIESVGKDAEYIFSFIEGLTKNYNGSVQDLLNILAQNANEEARPSWISYSVSNNEQKNAGEYVIPVSVTLSQEVADNYTNGVKDFATTVNGKINKIALTITASAEVEYGDEAPVITIDNGNGWVDSESYATYYESLRDELKDYVATGYGYGDNAGAEREIVWDNDAEEYAELKLYNYDVILETENFVVAKKVLNAADYAFAGYTGTYDAANHTLAVTGNLDLVNVTISSQATVKNVADSGNYTATIALKDAANYTFENGTHTGWTVSGNSASKSATVSITIVELEIGVEYTKTTATFSISGFVGGETEAVLTNLVYAVANSNLEANVYTISEYVADAQTVSATSLNTNYTIANATLRNIRKVEYVCDHDLGTNMPADELLFNGFLAEEPEAVSLTHYTFEGYKVANNKDAEDFDYTQNIEENKTIYVVFVQNEKYSLTLYYMVEGDAEHLTQVGEVLEFYSDDAIRYGHELPSMAAKDWFKVQEWYTDEALTTKYVEGTLSTNTTLYANYKFNIGLGDVNANGYVDANDITLYRQWIVGGYGEIEVEVGAEWALVNSDAYAANKASEAPKSYFVKRVADSNALTADSTVLGDEHLDIRDVSTIRMGLVGGYGFAIVEGKTVDGEALLVTRIVTIDSVSDLLAVARSGRAVQLADDITEENFVGVIVDCQNDVIIDLNGHEITVKSLSISLSANNTGKIEIKNGRINVADGNGVHLSAPAGSIVLDAVTLYDRDGIFELQAADQSLHFKNEVKFLKYNAQNVEQPLPAAVKVENGTHVVVESAAKVTVEKLVVTESFVPAQEASDAKITIDVESVVPQEIVVDGYVEVEEGAEEYVKPTYLEVATNAEFIAAANQTDIKVIKLTADLVDLGTVTFVGNVTIEGNGHIISGNSALRLNKLGAKVSNVKFQNIHNSVSQLTPIYGTNLEGKLEIENCEFNTVDWDAIQITPVAGAEVVIKNNIFRHSGENAVNTRRYVHIQSATNVDFAAAIENNKFYNVEYLSDTAIEVYYPTNESKVVILNNYVDAPVGVCILKNSGANAWYLANSFVEEDLETAVVMKAAIVETYNAYFFRTLQEAVDFAGQNQTTITLIDDASGDGVVVAENQNITFDFNGHTYTVNGKLVGSKGTETLGFQLLKGANVTFKNGTLKTVNAKMLIQNYANTTLDNFTVSGEGATQLQYVTSNNFGSMTVKAGSKILAYNNQVAFDLWYGMSAVYDDGVTVTLKAGSEVVGKVEYGAASRKASEDFSDKAVLNVEDGAVWDKVITLVSNIYVDHQIVIDKDLTLNLNGKTVKYIGETVLTSGLFGVKRGATLTINDTIGTGKIDASSNKIYAAVAITLKGEATTGEKAKVVVNGGTLEGYYYAIVGNGSRHNTEVVVNNGTLYGLNGTAIYNPQDGLVEINNGRIKGLETAIEIRAGELVINDGVFEALSEEFSIEGNGSGTTTQGVIIAVSQHTTLKNISVTINDGTFTNGICALAMFDTNNSSAHSDLMNVTINGGTFNTIVHAQNKTIHVNNGNLVINGGNFNCAPDSDGLGSTTVFAENYGYVTINGGTFKSSAKYANRYWILNVRNNAKDTAKMLVRGGTFYEFDPSNPNTDDSVSYVELGYSAEENDGVYTVVYVGINIGGQDPVNPPVENPAFPF